MGKPNIDKILSDLVKRRLELTYTIIPSLKLNCKDVDNRGFLIWDSENEVKEIDWLLQSFFDKGYSVPVVE